MEVADAAVLSVPGIGSAKAAGIAPPPTVSPLRRHITKAFPPEIWVVGLIAVVVILLLFFGLVL